MFNSSSRQPDFGIKRSKQTKYLSTNRERGGLGNSKINFPLENLWGWYLSTEAYSDAGFTSKITTNGARVYGLKDVNPAGTNNNLIQNNGSLQPFYYNTEAYKINDFPIINLYGGLILQSTNNVPNELSLYTVFISDMSNNSGSFAHIGNEVHINVSRRLSPPEIQFIGGNFNTRGTPTTTPNDTDPNIFSCHIKSNFSVSNSVRLNGDVFEAQDNGTYTANTNPFIIGESPLYTAKNAKIVELLLYSTSHGVNNVLEEIISNYLNNKYNIGINI